MILLVLEILILVRGIVGLATNRVTVRSGKVLTGQPAREIAWEYVLFMPALILFFIGVGVVAEVAGVTGQAIAFAAAMEFVSVIIFLIYIDRKSNTKFEAQRQRRRRKKRSREIATPTFE